MKNCKMSDGDLVRLRPIRRQMLSTNPATLTWRHKQHAIFSWQRRAVISSGIARTSSLQFDNITVANLALDY